MAAFWVVVSGGKGKLFQVTLLENEGSDFMRPPTVFIQVMNMEEEAMPKMIPSGSAAADTLFETITSGSR